ncbi:MAG: TolC family protein [Bacteroidales bacterium]|jgi:outer membrane protein|nr:TolC family protein [Bacteroidales bacterium]MBR4480165.1 TolC family protein [Bacteroidales bacterium]
MRRIILTAALVAAFAAGARAQERVWTLPQCIDHALENNLSVKRSGLNVEQREIDLNTAENNRLPSVSGSAGQNFSFGRGLTADNTYANTNTTNTSFSVGAQVPVFNGFQIKHNIELSKLNLAAATADLEKAKDDIRVAVAQAYVQILYNMEILDVARSQVEIDSLQVVRLTEMASNGMVASADVSAQEATLAQSRVSATQAENNVALAILDLTQLLELPSPEGFHIARPSVEGLETVMLMDPEAIYAEAVQFKPAVKAEEIRLDQALKSIDLAKDSFLPSLSLSGGLGTNYYTSSGFPSAGFSSQLKNNFSQYIGLNLSVPIFSHFSNRNQVRNARLQYSSQEIVLDNSRKSLYKEIQQAYYNAVGSQAKYRSSQIAAASAEDAFELAQAKYENGKSGITEFNEAKGRYMSAASNLVQARYEYLYQSKILDFYRGRDLEF